MPGRSRVPILPLHAFPLDARMWEARGAVLEQAGYEVIAPNLPGREPDNELSRLAERLLQLLPGNFVPWAARWGHLSRVPSLPPRRLDRRSSARQVRASERQFRADLSGLRRRNVATPELGSRTREPAR